jgi:hypothetical protein
MSSLFVPEEYRPALIRLAGLPQDAFQEFVSALESAPLQLDTGDLAAALAPRLRHADPTELPGLLEALNTLGFVKASSDVDLEQFVDDIQDALQKHAKQHPFDLEVLKLRLKALLSLPAIGVPAKARTLLIEDEHVFCRARIVTDIRPVFASNVTERPSAVVLVHKLKLSYHQGTTVRDFYVTMDEDDIGTLVAQLNRARQKAATLHPLLRNSGLPYLDTDTK